jgi:hypothetical protein
LEIEKIVGNESPFDFWIASESAGARTRYVRQDAVETTSKWQVPGVGG